MRTKSIIIAEDDLSIQDSMRMILERQGYEVTIYSNADMLLAENFEVPDLFILDKQLPGVGGLDICRFLKSSSATKDVPVVIFSASPQAQQMARLAGANDFLEKPFNITDLKKMVEKFVGGN